MYTSNYVFKPTPVTTHRFLKKPWRRGLTRRYVCSATFKEGGIMKPVVAMTLTVVVLVTGCATVEITERSTNLVMAKKVVHREGPQEITDSFTYEGNIYIFATFRWPEWEKNGGSQTVKVKWFNGERMLFGQRQDVNFGYPPWHVYFLTNGVALGTGKCKVEVYVNDAYVGSKSFSVSEQ